MGLLDQVIGSVLGNVLGGGQGRQDRQGGAGGSAAMSPLVKALLMLLATKALQGGFGDIFGSGRRPEASPAPAPYPRGDGGFEPRPGPRDADPDNPFSEFSGMLDGPGGAPQVGPRGGEARGSVPNPFDQGAGPYSGLDREIPDNAGPDGLGGLIDSFRRGGLGDVIESWIGAGPNRAVEPRQLAQALGPDTVDTLSRETGLSRDDLLAQLAQVLPGVIDGLTPQGRRPTDGEMRGW
ncbi:YidB family protein [Methylobacterium sp. ID0610]|uniref:YidB family protein n=1 Tax=Methylobacterium carpenticola TaxID=3344827 RepID=UPI0036D096B7